MTRRTQYKSMGEVPQHIRQKTQGYFSNLDGDVCVLRNLPSETKGAAMARFSRSPRDIRLVIINEFLDENGDPDKEAAGEFTDRVVNQFGDASVQQMTGEHVMLRGITQRLTKDVQDKRIGAAEIEQSSRYTFYDQQNDLGEWGYLRPREVARARLMTPYCRVHDHAFSTYRTLMGKTTTLFRGQLPREKFTIDVRRDGAIVKANERDLQSDDERREFNNAYNATIRGAACDVSRCVLPMSTLTQMGIYGNAAFFTGLLTKLKSLELAEANDCAAALERELNTTIPTFIKRNGVDKNYRRVDAAMREAARELFCGVPPEHERVTLVDRADYLDELVASCLYPYADISLQQITQQMGWLTRERKLDILSTYKGERNRRHDRTQRGIEAGYPLVFDIVCCIAEYRDLERHRMLTQQRQRYTPDIGFFCPPEVDEVGMRSQTLEAAEMMAGLNHTLRNAGLDEAAQYATLFNNLVRFEMGMNARELQHLAELRSGKAGHHGYRSIAMKMAELAIARHPEVGIFLEHMDYSDPDRKIARAEEQARIAMKNIGRGIAGFAD